MRKLIPLVIVLGIVAFVALALTGQYNGLVKLQEGVNAQWSQVENDYQRRADLIPNLVATVQGYAAHERETFEAVTQARARATQMQAQLTPEALNDPQTLARFQAVQGELSSALARLMVVVEQYPDLKANQNFLDLQVQLEGTENRISNSRRRFNEAAQGYNTRIRTFPTNVVASLFNFDKKAYFEAIDGAETAPKVQF